MIVILFSEQSLKSIFLEKLINFITSANMLTLIVHQLYFLDDNVTVNKDVGDSPLACQGDKLGLNFRSLR